MLHYSEYNLNDRGTIIALLVKGLPKDKMADKSFDDDQNPDKFSIYVGDDDSVNDLNEDGIKDPIYMANQDSKSSNSDTDSDDYWDSDSDSDSDDEDNYGAMNLDTLLSSNDITHLAVTYAKTLLYEFAMDFNNMGPTYERREYNGVYVQNTNDIIVDNPDVVYYGIPVADKQGSAGSGQYNIRAYKNTQANRDAIWIHELYQIQDVPLGTPDKAINALKSLWIAQSEQLNVDKQAALKSHKEMKMPYAFMQLFNELLVNITSVNKHTGPIKCTYADLIRFYHEVHNGKLTKATRDVQEWLFSQRTNMSHDTRANKILQILQLRPNYKSVIRGVKEIPKKSISKLRSKMVQDSVYKHYGFHLAHVYKMDYPQKQIRGKHHLTLIHGTNSSSIPTIIFDGLKTHDELVHDNANNFEDTGQSLGNGVYMTQPSQFTKSLNYSNYGDAKYKFIIVTDVAFNKPIKVNAFIGTPNKPYDMIFGDSVGWAHGYNEYVTRYSSQIRIKYILAFRHNSKKSK